MSVVKWSSLSGTGESASGVVATGIHARPELRPITRGEWEASEWIEVTSFSDLAQEIRVYCEGKRRTEPPDDGLAYVRVDGPLDPEYRWAPRMTSKPEVGWMPQLLPDCPFCREPAVIEPGRTGCAACSLWSDSPEEWAAAVAQREDLVYQYVAAHAPALLRPGVAFTEEQMSALRENLAAGQIGKAQGLILDELDAHESGSA